MFRKYMEQKRQAEAKEQLLQSAKYLFDEWIGDRGDAVDPRSIRTIARRAINAQVLFYEVAAEEVKNL